MEFSPKKARLGSSIKTTKANGKEDFLTVESIGGDIALFRKGTKVATRERKMYNDTQYFSYNDVNYKLGE